MNLLKIENEFIKIVLAPAMGGKIVSLFSKRTGTEYMLGLPFENRSIPEYGAPFDIRFAYGFDECFPTIKACQLQTVNGPVNLPDHGELWSRSWEYDRKENVIELSIEGKKLDYLFIKEIKLSGASLKFNYRLKNNSNITHEYLWSAHPLLSVKENDIIFLDKNCDKMLVYWASGKEVESLAKFIDWPPKVGNAGATDLSIVQNIDSNIAMKLFSTESSVGRAGLYKNNADESLVFSVDNTKIPYFGIWLCYGGWPVDDKKSLTVALEPTNAQTDSLSEAIRTQKASKIKSNKVYQWRFQCTLVTGKAII